MNNKMNHELAKKLKEAGYPLDAIRNHPNRRSDDDEPIFVIENVWYYPPTLSELIEACGDNFVSLNKYRPVKAEERNGFERLGWMANYAQKYTIEPNGTETWDDFIGCGGTTPEIAVANLWLELNNKNGEKLNAESKL